MDQGNEDSSKSLGGRPDNITVTCPRCNQQNSIDAETCKRCRLDFTLRERTKHLASISEPEGRQVKADRATGKVKGGMPESEYQALSNDHAATRVERILPRSKPRSNLMILLAFCAIILGWILPLVFGSDSWILLAMTVTIFGLTFLAHEVIERNHPLSPSNRFRKSNSIEEGMVVVRRARRFEDNYGEVHSSYYLTIEFDAGDRMVWLKTKVDGSVYYANPLKAKLSVRYCDADPRIALIGREITRDI